MTMVEQETTTEHKFVSDMTITLLSLTVLLSLILSNRRNISQDFMSGISSNWVTVMYYFPRSWTNLFSNCFTSVLISFNCCLMMMYITFNIAGDVGKLMDLLILIYGVLSMLWWKKKKSIKEKKFIYIHIALESQYIVST